MPASLTSEDVFRDARDIDTAAQRAIGIDGRDVVDRGGVVDARIEARTLAVIAVHMGQLFGIDGDHGAATGHRPGHAISERNVRLARQQHRHAQRHVGIALAADDRDRAADRIHAVVEGAEDLRVAAIHDGVVDRDHGDLLRGHPVGVIELDELTRRDLARLLAADRGRGCVIRRRIGQFADRDRATIDDHLIGARIAIRGTRIIREVDLRTQRGSDVRQRLPGAHGMRSSGRQS